MHLAFVAHNHRVHDCIHEQGQMDSDHFIAQKGLIIEEANRQNFVKQKDRKRSDHVFLLFTLGAILALTK
jgi:hypothetical protein